jgi:hypothetical protein
MIEISIPCNKKLEINIVKGSGANRANSKIMILLKDVYPKKE